MIETSRKPFAIGGLIIGAVFSGFFTTNVYAQDTSSSTNSESIEEITVVARFQRSQADALAQKQRSDTVVDAIGLQDIGQLPGKSIADSLAGVTGVAGARTDDGNVSQLSIRGSAELTLTTLNGREQVTISGDRNVEYAMYPPNVMTSVQVYKSSKASLLEGGLALVNMQTIKPMDYKERNLIVDGEVNSQSAASDVVNADDIGGRASITYIDQLSDTFGLSLAYAYANETILRNGHLSPFSWGLYQFGSPGGGFGPPTDDLDGDGIIAEENIPFGFTTNQLGGSEKRNSVFAAFQFTPSDAVDVNVDILYSTKDIDNVAGGVNIAGTVTRPGADYSNLQFNGDDLFGATISNFPAPSFFGAGISSFNQIATIEDEVTSGGINAKFFTENWTFAGDLSFSSASHDERFDTANLSLTPVGTTTLTYNAYNGASASVAADFSDPANWVPLDYIVQGRTFDDELTALALNAERSFDSDSDGLHLVTLKSGIRFASREKDILFTSTFDSWRQLPLDASPLDQSFLSFVATPAGGNPYGVFDVNSVAARFGAISQPAETIPGRNADLTSSGSIEEDTVSGFVELSFASEGSLPFSGNIGLRYYDADINAPGWRTDDRNNIPATPIVISHGDYEFLPSFNISIFLTDTQTLRLGWADVIARPPIDDMRSSKAIFVSGFGASGFAGNPQLDPTKASQTNISYEWYPADDATIAIAGYYSDLDTFIGTTFNPETINGVSIPIETVENGTGGYIRGFEITALTSFGIISEALSGTGASFNWAVTESNILPVGGGGATAFGLTGLSENVGSLNVWWAGEKFEARVGLDYRSEYISTSIFGEFETIDESTLLRANFAYDITDQFRINVFGSNLTDEERGKYTGNIAARTGFTASYGRTIGINVYYKL